MQLPYVTDPGAILRSGAALIPNLAEQYAQQQQIDLQRQDVGLRQQVFQAKQQDDQREQAEAAAYQRDMEMVGTLPPDQQPQALAALSRRYPKQSEALKRSWDMQDAAVKDANFRETADTYFLIKNGAADKAAAQIRKRIEADKAAGQDTEDDEAIAAALESGDPAEVGRAMAAVTAQLQVAAGPERFAAISGVVSPEQAAFEKEYQFYVSKYGQAAADNWARNRYDPFVESNNKYGTTFYRSSDLAGGGPAPSQGVTGGGGEPSGGGVATGGGNGVDRGTRNNNPGNLKDGPFARRQPGYKGADRDGFAVFDSPSAGTGAQERLLSANYLAKGHDTPAKVISRYAPAGENSPASMNNYAAYVARRLGIGVNDKVPAGKAALMAKAMREFETGQTVKGAAPAAKGGPRRVTSRAQFQSLASGTEFVGPDGKRYRKP